MSHRPRRRWIPWLLAAALLVLANGAQADEHDPRAAAHPLRIAAYVLHPVGWVIDRLVVRPAHWLVHQEPLDEVFGHRD